MYKIITTTCALGLFISLNAQVTPQKLPVAAQIALPAQQKALTGFEQVMGTPVLKPQPASFYAKSWNETMMGETVYDLMSNASIQNRNLFHSDGTISAGFTFGMVQPAFAERGTGYNYYNGTAWGANPSARIESIRCGWPSIMVTGAGSEIIVSHQAAGPLVLNKRATKGSGTWTESNIPTNTGMTIWWPRVVSGGANGNSLHCISITAPIANGGTTYQGIDGALLYWRSLDQGATWDIVDAQLPGLDSTFFNRTVGDSYSIIADGDKIAIAVFSIWGDMVLFISNDNGTTWTNQIVNDFPLDLYIPDQANGSDINGDMIPDTIATADGCGAIIFDANGMVHMTFGRMRVLDANLGDGNTSYFPGTQELMYWNESMGTGNFTVIAVPEDIDGDLQLGFAGAFALYGRALCSYPSMGINNDGSIFVAYAGYREDFATATQNFRHIYVTKTMDGGNNWVQPLDVTPDPFFDYYESMFPHVAPMIDNKVRIMYMRDSEPGLAAIGDLDAYGLNAIMYIEADTNLINDLGINELSSSLVQSKLYPNPSENQVKLSLTLSQAKTVSILLTNLKGEKINFTKQVEMTEGEHEIDINTAELASGVYFIRIGIDGKNRTEKLVVKH